MVLDGKAVILFAAIEGDREVKPKEIGRRRFIFIIIFDWLWEERYIVLSLE